MTKKCEEKEKWLEKHLSQRVKETGGLGLKYSNPIATGFPDRMILYPNGTVLWAEMKTRGKEPTPLQLHRLAQLRALGFHTWVCDSRETVEEIVATGVRISRKRARTRGSGSFLTATNKGP